MLGAPCPRCRFVRFVPIVDLCYDPLSNGKMHLISGITNISNMLYAKRRIKIVKSLGLSKITSGGEN